MKKFIVILTIVLSLFVVSNTDAEECCVCVEGVEFTMEGAPFDPPKIEKLQILSILKKNSIENAVINFYDKFKGNNEMEGAQINVMVVTGKGELFEGSARVSGGYDHGLAKAVRDALNFFIRVVPIS